MTNAPPLPAPVAGRYRPVALLGNGGMGTVWEAVDDRLRRPVALKVAATADDGVAERSRAEARALAAVHHPNVVAVLDAGEHEGRAFVVTELVRGPSLRALMTAGPMPPDRVARLGHQLASALACAHEHGVVHRDLTPANVLLDVESGEAKLIDFGIAMSEHAVGLTVTGTVVGTPAYLAPEQVEGRRATSASDVYALGLVLLEALTGARAFPGGPAATTAARLVADAPVPDDLPEAWARVIGPMTRRDPDRRPTSSAAAADLAALAPTITAAAPVGTPTLVDLTRVGPATAASAPTTATTVTAASTRTMPAATAAGRVGGTARQREHRARAWPLVLAGTALVLALGVLAGFGMWNRAGTSDGPDVVATDTSAVTTSTTDPTSTASLATVVTASSAPTPTTTSTTTSTTADVPAAAPSGKGKDAAATKGGGPGGKGKG